MSEDPNTHRYSSAMPNLSEAIRGTALGALLAGGICLYFGFTWLIDAPGSADEESTQLWYTTDHVIRWVLKIVGAAFLLVAAWATTGDHRSALLGTIVEGAFALTLFAIALETLMEGRADGVFAPSAILFLIIMVISIGAARYSWRLYTHSVRLHELPTE